jgi:phage terminase small subunit
MDESNQLAANKEAFRILGNKELQEIQNKQNDITHREEMLEKGWKDLLKEKAEYKEKIIAEVQKQMGLDVAIKRAG